MSDRDEVARAATRHRLEWLRLLGVGELKSNAPAAPRPARSAVGPAAAPDAPVPPAPAPGPAVGLFGPVDDPPEPAPAARRGARAAESASPLLGLVPPGSGAPAEALQQLRETIGDCRRCRLSEKRTHLVFGVGDPKARLMFIGEGPGADEDLQGEPFVGRAGQLLNRIIEAMGLRRDQVYIANVVKCRPPENRTPLPDEVATCSPFLLQQIAAIGPRVIVCLGTPAAQAILGTRETITRLRGAFRDVGGFRVMPTFHPAYLLRNPAAKRDVWDDMKLVIAALAQG